MPSALENLQSLRDWFILSGVLASDFIVIVLSEAVLSEAVLVLDGCWNRSVRKLSIRRIFGSVRRRILGYWRWRYWLRRRSFGR